MKTILTLGGVKIIFELLRNVLIIDIVCFINKLYVCDWLFNRGVLTTRRAWKVTASFSVYQASPPLAFTSSQNWYAIWMLHTPWCYTIRTVIPPWRHLTNICLTNISLRHLSTICLTIIPLRHLSTICPTVSNETRPSSVEFATIIRNRTKKCGPIFWPDDNT